MLIAHPSEKISKIAFETLKIGYFRQSMQSCPTLENPAGVRNNAIRFATVRQLRDVQMSLCVTTGSGFWGLTRIAMK